MDSSRNIEIKAEIKSQSDFDDKVEIAKKLCKSTGEIIEQRDIFFNSSKGRLKLRYLKVNISYNLDNRQECFDSV